MPRSNAASLGTGSCLAPESMAAHMAAGLLGSLCLASNQWLHAWRQHVAWHMVPRSNQLLHAMQHRLARDASLQNQWLRTWWQDCVARDASLRINGCTHGGSMSLGTWCLARISCCMQCSTAWHWMPRIRINGCAHGSRIAWLVMSRFESMAARMAAASLGTWCLARISCCMRCSTAWHGMPYFRINGCAHGSRIAWLVTPRFESMAARMAAASLGTWCLARIRYCMQCSIAWHWMPCFRINGYAHGSRIPWLVMPRFESMAACMAAASLGTWCLARISCCMQGSIA